MTIEMDWSWLPEQFLDQGKRLRTDQRRGEIDLALFLREAEGNPITGAGSTIGWKQHGCSSFLDVLNHTDLMDSGRYTMWRNAWDQLSQAIQAESQWLCIE